MLVFHELAYEGYVVPSSPNQNADPRLMELIGSVDIIHVSGYATQISGASPVLSFSLDYTNDRSAWQADWGADVSLPADETLFQATSSATIPRNAYGRINLAMGPGTDARAYVRLWVTGRDFSRRATAGGGTRPAVSAKPAPASMPTPRVGSVLRQP